MDISKNISVGWISGMPRSGTSWLSQIFASSPSVKLKLCPLFSYEFKNRIDGDSTSEQWSKLFSEVYHTKSTYMDQEFLRAKGLVPTFKNKKKEPEFLIIKSTRYHHLIPKMLELNKGIRAIHIVRNPCACLYSWISNPLEFPNDADPKEEWRSGSCRKTGPGEFWGFDDWKIVTRQALRLSYKFPGRHKLIRYEDLLTAPYREAQKLFEFLGIPFEEQTKNFVRSSHSRHDARERSVYKDPTKSDRWRKLLDPEIASECLNELKGSDLEIFTKN